MYTISNQFGQVLGQRKTIGGAVKVVEQWFQGGIQESQKEIKSRIALIGKSWATLRIDDSVKCWIAQD